MVTVSRLWMLPPFEKQLEKRKREEHLLEGVFEAVATLRRATPGRNFEKLFETPGGRPVFSIRIDQAARVILIGLKSDQYGLLTFDTDHDGVYNWAQRNRAGMDATLEKIREIRPGERFVGPTPGLLANEGEPLAIRGADDIRQMVAHGVERYLTTLDESQAALAGLDIRNRQGPVLVRGAAGTGKTALAISRVKHLIEQPEMGYRIPVYLCFSNTLRTAVLELLAWHYGGVFPKNQVVVTTFHGFCTYYMTHREGVLATEAASLVNADAGYLELLVRTALERMAPADGSQLNEALAEALAADDQASGVAGADASDGPTGFVTREITSVIMPSGVTTLNDYLALERKGHRRLRKAGREAVWSVHETLRASRGSRKWTFDELVEETLAAIESDPNFVPHRGVVIDEAQDCGRTMVRLTRAMVGGDERRLYFLVDPNQGIFPNGFQWAARELGAGGRQTNTLRTSYRNTVQVEAAAETLKEDHEASPAPATREGPVPALVFERDRPAVARAIVERVRQRLTEGQPDGRAWQPSHVGILAPTRRHLAEIDVQLTAASIPSHVVSPSARGPLGLGEASVKLMTLHAAKGLDFPLVFVALDGKGLAWLDDDVQRRLLYVAMTRAAFELTIVAPVDDMPPVLADLDTEHAVRITGPQADDGAVLLGRIRRGETSGSDELR